MRLGGLPGVSHRRKRHGWKPDTATHEDLVKRQFRAAAPNRLWLCDITQHRSRDGWVYCAAVIDAFSRRIVGWSISDRITAEIAKKRHGNVYCYFVCSSRHSKRTDCTPQALLIEDVEMLIEDYYTRVQISPSRTPSRACSTTRSTGSWPPKPRS